GRGPRAGSDTSFHGHIGGINHSMASRLGCPWPMIFPSRSTRYPRTEIILPGTGSIEPGNERRSNSSFSQPLPQKWPGSLESVKRPARYAPRGNTACPNCCTPRAWQITGSPTGTEGEERFGSSSVQFSSVPAGSVTSCAFADCSKHKNGNTNTTARKKDLISHLPIRGQPAQVRD